MSLGALVDAALVVSATAHLVSVVVLLAAVSVPGRWPRPPVVVSVALAFGAGAAAAGWVGGDRSTVVPAAVAGAVISTGLAYRWRAFRPDGALVWSSFLMLGASLAVWGAHFLAALPVSAPTLALLWAAAVMSGLTVPSSLLQTLEGWEVLLRRRWTRPKDPLVGWRPAGRPPLVSIHVPAHAEPPELVTATLDALSRLDYPHFEVLVIDNNTTDASLWRPVEQHCERLGPRFRFLHVEGLTGAKAGALNWALPHTDPAAEFVAVVDADYQVDPDWLAHTVGHFDDPAVGFVQCPHAYRDYQASTFGKMANTEYAVFFATSMVSLSEHGAGLTVGTMSVIRRQALAQAGGWAEWCLTEDSELAIRIHAAGYTSVYLARPYGWGLIPETFAGYKKQRFRWTYGPVQELRRHARLYTPRRWRQPSALTARQRIHHANHGLDVAMIGLRLLVVPVGAAALLSMLWHGETIPMPLPLWIAATATLTSSLVVRWLVYRHAVGATLRQAMGGAVAFLALSHIIAIASLSAVAGRTVPWQRTDKFRPRLAANPILHEARTESLLAVSCFLAAAAALVAMPQQGLTTALALGIAWQGVSYAAAPLVAAIAERDLRRQITPTTFAVQQRLPAAD